jgi:serine/threonine protein kinase
VSSAGNREISIEEGPLLATWTAGLSIGRYTLMGKIAVGGMAEIWLARQSGPKGFEKVVVIKKILDSFCQDEGFVEMFLDEARTAAQLNHPNVVQIYDLGEHNQAYFIAMEYLAGETLARVARNAVKEGTPLPYTFAARLIADAAAGLGYAHSKKSLGGQPLNIVHRDVSPQNLILTYDGQLKVLDFGVARAANRATLTEEGKFKGKVPYMSPEQARAMPIDRRADIFALGIILYELIGRCRLFQHEDFIVGLKAVASEEKIPSPVTRNPEVPEGLAAVALKALERDPENRYQTGEQLRAGLEDWLRTQPSSPGSPELSAYMHQLFSERIEKTARLIESARAGIVGTVDSTVGKLGSTPLSDSSMPGGLTPLVTMRPRRPRWIFGVAGLAGALLVTGGFALRPAPVVTAEPAPVAIVPASLSIDTDPPGAAVTVDGLEYGPAPVSVDAIKLGKHTIRATAEDFEPGERTLDVQRNGERTNLLLTLKPIAARMVETDAGMKAVPRVVAKGKLTLSTTPWSQVFEGNKKLGETPLVELSLPVGKHTLRLKNDERGLAKTISVEIKAGKTTLLREKL